MAPAQTATAQPPPQLPTPWPRWLPPGPAGCPELWTCWGRGGSLLGCHRGAAEGRRPHGVYALCSLLWASGWRVVWLRAWLSPPPLHSPRPPLPSGAPRPQACLCRVHVLEAPGCSPRARLPGSPCGHKCPSLGGGQPRTPGRKRVPLIWLRDPSHPHPAPQARFSGRSCSLRLCRDRLVCVTEEGPAAQTGLGSARRHGRRGHGGGQGRGQLGGTSSGSGRVHLAPSLAPSARAGAAADPPSGRCLSVV